MKFSERRTSWLKLIETFNLPDMRREPTVANLRWFLRNSRIQNQAHPKMERAWEMAKSLLEDLE
jgi:hypothetical protein